MWVYTVKQVQEFIKNFVYPDGTACCDATWQRHLNEIYENWYCLRSNVKPRIWKAEDISKETSPGVSQFSSVYTVILFYNAETRTLKEETFQTITMHLSTVRKVHGIRNSGCSIRAHIHKDGNIRMATWKKIGTERDTVEALNPRHIILSHVSRYPRVTTWSYWRQPLKKKAKKWRLDNVIEDCKAVDLSLPDADRLAQNRSHWRTLNWNY